MSELNEDVTARSWRSRILGFRKNTSGATAIEFGMLALPFIMLTFAIMEVCIAFAAQELLNNATDDVARQLRTGQVRSENLTQDGLKQMICDRISLLVSAGCPGLKVDLRSYNTFADAAAVRIVYTGTDASTRELAATNFGYDPGVAMAKEMLRVFYEWPVMTDIMRSKMSTLKDGKTLLFSTATWENEPFTD